MASDSPGKGILFSGTVGTSAIASVAFDVSQMQQMSFQIRTDGTNAVNYTIQASNVPAQANDFGPPYRSDTTASIDWATVQTGSVAPGTGGSAGLATLNFVPFRFCRILLTSTAITVTAVYAFGTGSTS